VIPLIIPAFPAGVQAKQSRQSPLSAVSQVFMPQFRIILNKGKAFFAILSAFERQKQHKTAVIKA